MLDTLLWTEKYRPTRLADVALADDTRTVFEAYLAAEEIPHLLLVGPAGSGKTSVARILLDTLDCQVLELNASKDRGIDVVRSQIANFVTAVFGWRWNIVFLDEADALTTDAQTALRNLVETYADRSRFVLTANEGHKIIDPLRSRCQVLTLPRPPVKERYRILQAVLAAENISAAPEAVLAFADRYPDMRTMLMRAQRAVQVGRTNVLPMPTVSTEMGGLQILEAIERKNWRGLRLMASSSEFDHAAGLRDLFWAIPDEHPRVGFLRHVVGRGVHESGYTPDVVVLFLAVCAECMEGLA